MSVWSMINGHTTPIFVENSHEKDSRYSTWSPHSFLSANLYSNLYSGILFLCATLDILTSLALLLP